MQIQQNIQLSNILWYKIGGNARYLIKCESKEDIFEAVEFINKSNINKIFICGFGSNLVFTDDYFDGAVIQIATNQEKPSDIKVIENQLEALAPLSLDFVIRSALEHNLTGLEWAGGLPGSIGAAIRGNVGAYGGELKDTLSEAEVLKRKQNGEFELIKIKNQDLHFAYRHSLIKDNPGDMIVLSATFSLKPGSPEDIKKAREIYELHIKQRQLRHPLEYPNCGSVFKNIREPEKIEKVLRVFPEIEEKINSNWYGKVAAGYLIQKLGLQGKRIGDAQVSEKHALFIVNLGRAKASDVLALINTIQKKFSDTFGFVLEPEIEIVK